MTFVPASSLAVVGTVTVTDTLAESYLSTIAANTATLSGALSTLTTNTAQLAGTQPVSIASLPLPSGAATEATLKRVERSVDETALQQFAPEVLDEGA